MRLFAGLLVSLLLLGAAQAKADTAYVSDYSKINMRSGKGMDYRIVAILKTGDKVDLLETDGDWARVRLAGGMEGWILSRLLTTGEPCKRLLARAEDALSQANEKLDELKIENQLLMKENAALEQEAADQESKHRALQARFDALRSESQDLFDLKQSVEEAAREEARLRQAAQEAQDKLKKLEKDSTHRWFLAGAGVLFFGLLLGRLSRSGRSSSLLR